MVLGEFSLEFMALVAKGVLIEKVKRRAKFPSQVHNITATDAEMAVAIYFGS